MSKGLGKVQRQVLATLAKEGMLDSIDIAARALGRNTITESEAVSFRRALRLLAAAGQVVDMGRQWHDKRRRWATPERAGVYRERVRQVFGVEPLPRPKKK